MKIVSLIRGFVLSPDTLNIANATSLQAQYHHRYRMIKEAHGDSIL